MNENEKCAYKEICEDKFDVINRRLNAKSDALDSAEKDIIALKTNFQNLTRSLNALTKALWGMTAATLTALFGFLLWYVQNT